MVDIDIAETFEKGILVTKKKLPRPNITARLIEREKQKEAEKLRLRRIAEQEKAKIRAQQVRDAVRAKHRKRTAVKPVQMIPVVSVNGRRDIFKGLDAFTKMNLNKKARRL